MMIINDIKISAIITLAALAISSNAIAQAHKCADADGAISYQESPCNSEVQKSLSISIEATIPAATTHGDGNPFFERLESSFPDSSKDKTISAIRSAIENAPTPIQNYPAIKAIILFFIAISLLIISFKRKPKEKEYTCSRCNKMSPHTQRTIEAWRHKKKEFFCQKCHAKWLQSRPTRLPPSKRTSNSGCLGLVIIFSAIPIALLFYL